VVPIKTGAARIALGQEARPGQAGRLTLLPVGLHFAERTGFWTDVVVSVGSPVDLSSYRTGDGADNAEVVRDLTARIQQSLEELILKLDVDRAGLVHAIEEIYRAEFATGDDGLDRTRNLAQCVEHFARSDPDRVQRAWLRIRRYHERLKKLHIRDQTVRELLPSEGRVFERARLVVLGLLGVIPALIGGAIHYLPYRACAIIGRTSDPTRVAAFRIGLAVVVFPLAYGLLAYLLWRLGWSGLRIAIVLGVLAVLGLHALVYFNWLSRQGQRIRLLLFKISNRRLVARLRHERRSIVRMCETAMGEYREIIGPKVRS